MYYYSAIKKNKILTAVTTWIDLEGIILSETSQTENRYLYDLTFMWNVKHTHTCTHNTENRLVAARGRWWGEWAKWLKGIKRYEFPVIE